MPLIGLSAHIIPYIMAMIFTMLFFNGNSQDVADKTLLADSIISGHTISFIENQGTTPDSFHYTDHISSDIFKTLFKNTSENRLTCRINSPYNSGFLYSIPLESFSYRGPPSFVF